MPAVFRICNQKLPIILAMTAALFLAGIILLPGLGTYADEVQAQDETTGAEAPVVAHNTWSSGTPMPTARQGTCVGVVGENIYVIGGATSSAVLGNNEIYNTKTKVWTTGAPMPTPMWASASAVVNSVVYCIGGAVGGSDTQATVQAYNPATDSWSTKSPMPTSRNSITAAVEKGIIYVIGGFAFGPGRLTTVESYNPATDTWTEAAPLHVGKSWAAVGPLGATIVAAGGLTNSGVTGDNEGYKKNVWSTLTADPTPRQSGCFAGFKGSLYFAGGSDNNGNPLSVTEAYGAKTKSWTALASISQAVIAPGSATLGGKLYCFGGTSNGNLFQGTVYDNVQIYQP
jgi:N-acetylneuraminic acid mutarotase